MKTGKQLIAEMLTLPQDKTAIMEWHESLSIEEKNILNAEMNKVFVAVNTAWTQIQEFFVPMIAGITEWWASVEPLVEKWKEQGNETQS